VPPIVWRTVMPDASSADIPGGGSAGALPSSRAAVAGDMLLSPSRRLVMILCGFLPLVHAAAAIAPVALVGAGMSRPRMLVIAPIVLYLAPALLVRACTWARPLPSGAFRVGSGAFLWWWFTAQPQVIFSRLPFLEELLRVVPGLYSAWLRIWGARIGAFVYWSPGVAIADRSLVRIGDRVVFGMGVRLNAHVLAPGADGSPHLYLAPVHIGSDTLVGGYSLVLAGCEIAPGQVTPPLKTLHPFTRWAGGRRTAVEGSPLVRGETAP
jgi:hypothetical protein